MTDNKRETSLLKQLRDLNNEREYHRSRFLALDKAHVSKRNFPELEMKLSDKPQNCKGWFRKEMVSREKQIFKLLKD